jgi:predicted branched-subunit amino acid permease
MENMQNDSTGRKAALPIVLGYVPAAMAFGVAARGAGFSVAEAVLCSLIVFSGASQLALVGLLGAGASWLVALPATLLLTARHALYGPALAPRLRGLGAR